MASPLLDTALALHDHGCCVLPAATDGTKRPAVPWKAYQSERPSREQVADWFTNGHHQGLGVVCGEISGGLEMYELEARAVAEHLHHRIRQLADDSGLGELWARVIAGYTETTPSGGIHLLYRVHGAPVAGNTKLARRPATPDELAEHPDDTVKVLAETRGEGGWVVLAPSSGTTHPTGRPWALAAGGPATIATITPDERDALHTLAAAHDQLPDPAQPVAGQRAALLPFQQPPKPEQPDGATSPGDDYAARTSWEQLLEPHGWRVVVRRGDGSLIWRRPGKDRGLSATTGYGDGDWLYVFSTSTPFQANTTYTRFGAYTVLEHGGDHAAAARALAAAGYGTPPPAERALRLVHSATDPRPATDTHAAPTDGSSALAPDAKTHTYEVSLTDDGNAVLLVNEHAHHVRYVPERGKWLVWAGHRWEWDDAATIVELARSTIRSIDPGDDHAAAKHRKSSLSRRAIEAMVALGRSDTRIVVPAANLDADPYALCTPAGVIDLRTGVLHPPSRDQLHTRSTTYAPDPHMPTPRWRAFLEQTFGGHLELMPFVQRLAGYSATGTVTHHVLPFLHGPGENGKSVFLDVVRRVLGDYAASAPAGFLMAGQQQHETEVARLSGLRFVICSEVNQEARFDEAKVKLLTGGDALTARFMRADHFTFTPTHHLWLMGNHQPRVSSGGNSFWRRLRLVPFGNTVPAEAKIEGLDRLLADEEGPGILAWIVQGAAEALKDGLREPDLVMAVTREYAAEEDALARFLDDRCLLGGGVHVKLDTARFRAAYTAWCRDEGEKELTPQVLGRELRSRYGIEQAKSHGRRLYVGLALLELESEEPPDEDHVGDPWRST